MQLYTHGFHTHSLRFTEEENNFLIWIQNKPFAYISREKTALFIAPSAVTNLHRTWYRTVRYFYDYVNMPDIANLKKKAQIVPVGQFNKFCNQLYLDFSKALIKERIME